MSREPRAMEFLPERETLGALGPSLMRAGAGIALAGFAALAALSLSPLGNADVFFHAWLHNAAYFLSLSLGALFFVLIQHLTGATWSVPVRRLGEVAAANVGTVALLFVPVLFGIGHLYHWSDPARVAADPILRAKQGWLNAPFFVVRMVVYFAVWITLATVLLRRSTRQDGSGDPEISRSLTRLSAPGVILYAITLTLAAFDLLMSLDARWYSTMFGVYYFAGSVVAAHALNPVVAWALQKSGRLTRIVGIRQYHDMGNLTFAFTVFWAYIAFSQYMLIWYTNLPEETEWYFRRQTGGWDAIGWTLLFGHFLVPFLVLMSRYVKRRPAILVAAAIWVLIMHWVDLYWVVMPEVHAQRRLDPLDLACFVGMAGVYLAGGAWLMSRRGLFAARDPRLADSLAAESV